jgi:hypothetical protein
VLAVLIALQWTPDSAKCVRHPLVCPALSSQCMARPGPCVAASSLFPLKRLRTGASSLEAAASWVASRYSPDIRFREGLLALICQSARSKIQIFISVTRRQSIDAHKSVEATAIKGGIMSLG